MCTILLGRTPHKSCRLGPKKMPVEGVRMSNLEHYSEPALKQGRFKLCEKNTMYMCMQYDVLQPTRCSFEFHNMQLFFAQ